MTPSHRHSTSLPRLSPPPRRPEQRRDQREKDADYRRRHPAGAVALDAATEVHFERAAGTGLGAGGVVKILRLLVIKQLFKAGFWCAGFCDADRFDMLTHIGRADISVPSRASADGEAAVENRFEALTGQVALDCRCASRFISREAGFVGDAAETLGRLGGGGGGFRKAETAEDEDGQRRAQRRRRRRRK